MDNGITIPSGLEGFINTNTTIANTVTDRSIYLIDGMLQEREEDRICPRCGRRMHRSDTYDISSPTAPMPSSPSTIH